MWLAASHNQVHVLVAASTVAAQQGVVTRGAAKVHPGLNGEAPVREAQRVGVANDHWLCAALHHLEHSWAIVWVTMHRRRCTSCCCLSCRCSCCRFGAGQWCAMGQRPHGPRVADWRHVEASWRALCGADGEPGDDLVAAGGGSVGGSTGPDTAQVTVAAVGLHVGEPVAADGNTSTLPW